MSALLYLLTILIRSVVAILRFFGNGGTAVPGYLVEKYFPWIINGYASKYNQIILITGTNGKTTTQLLIRHVLRDQGLDVVSNTSGSNMFRGIATTVISSGMPKSTSSVLLLEVEEGTMPKIAPYIRPHKVIITNFFRDQLDAYGELSKTVEYVRLAISSWPEAKLYVNSDDAHVSRAVLGLKNEKRTFSMGEFARDFLYEKSAEITTESDVICRSYIANDDFSTQGDLYMRSKQETVHFSLPLPGEYNIYNFMASLLVCADFGLPESQFIQAAKDVENPFGRGEKIMISSRGGDVTFRIFLIKNPAGMTQVWNMVRGKLGTSHLVAALNDNVADGRDISWIWDVRLDKVASQRKIIFTGTRAHDMAIRFKYAGFDVQKSSINTNISSAINTLVRAPQGRGKYIVLATYTAMNQIREVLSKYAKIDKYK